MRKTLIALGGATLLLGALVPATFAAAPVTFSYTDHYVVQHECGITETVDVSVDGKAFFDSDGTWLRDLLQWRYQSWFEGPGGAFPIRTAQSGVLTPTTGTLRGQGIFIRGNGMGVVFHDVGRLVFDRADGSTLFATPKVLLFNDPEGAAALEAALCEVIG